MLLEKSAVAAFSYSYSGFAVLVLLLENYPGRLRVYCIEYECDLNTMGDNLVANAASSDRLLPRLQVGNATIQLRKLVVRRLNSSR